MAIQGRCLCGDVAYELSGPIEALSHCHCSMCRKTCGAAFSTYVASPLGSFRWLRGTDQIRRHAISFGRGFCGRCGSSAPAAFGERVFLPAGPLEGDAKIGPMPHIFVGSKAPWYEITDGAEQHDAYPPGWGDAVDFPRKTERAAGAVRGSCLCGGVAFEVTGELRAPIILCHCLRCRRARGAPFATNTFAPREQFRFLHGQDKVELFKLPEAVRFGQAFCRDCGSPTPRVAPDRAVVGIPCGAFDDDPGVRPELHIFVDSKAPWFEITDDLPQHAESSPGPFPPVSRRFPAA